MSPSKPGRKPNRPPEGLELTPEQEKALEAFRKAFPDRIVIATLSGLAVPGEDLGQAQPPMIFEAESTRPERGLVVMLQGLAELLGRFGVAVVLTAAPIPHGRAL